MTTYLHIQAGPHRLLVAVDRVVEVGDLGGAVAAGRRAWRNRNLPVTDLLSYLGVEGRQARQQVVVGRAADGDDTEIIDVEQVIGLVEQSPSAFVDVPGVTDVLERLIDGVCYDQQAHALLRLRQPFGWHATPARDNPEER